MPAPFQPERDVHGHQHWSTIQHRQDAKGHQRGEQLLTHLDAERDLNALRALSPEILLDAGERSGWAAQSRIVVDGWVLPNQPGQIYALGKQAKVPLLLGSVANEGHELIPLNPSLTLDEQNSFPERMPGPPLSEERLALYAEETQQSPGLAQREITTDLFLAYGMRTWSRHQINIGAPTYLYFMDHIPPAFRLYWPDNADLGLAGGPRSAGAYHSGDLAYVFGNTQRVGMDWREDDHKLAALITRYWTNFAKTGNPNGEGLPQWPSYNTQDHSTLMLNPDAHAVTGVRRDRLDFWDRRYASQ